MSDRSEGEFTASVAALAITESLLISLAQLKIISGDEVRGLLADAAAPFKSNAVSSMHATNVDTEITEHIDAMLRRNYGAWGVGL